MIYCFTFCGLLVLSIWNLDHPKKKSMTLYVMLIASSWLILHDGLRWDMATDWDKYYVFFQNCLTDNPEKLEPGYVFFSKVVRSITDSYTIFLVLFAIFEYSVISWFCRKFTPYPLVALWTFYFLFVPYMGMNRQFLSMLFCLISVKFIIDRSFLKFLICILMAFQFHKSCIMFIPAYFLKIDKFKTVFVYILIGCLAISLSGILNKIPTEFFFVIGGDYVGDKMEAYVNRASMGGLIGMISGLLRRSIWLFLIVYKLKCFLDKKNFMLFFYIYLVGVMVYILFYGTIFEIIVERGVIFYTIFEIVIIPYLFMVYNSKYQRSMMLLLVSLYGIYTIYKGFKFYADLGVDVFNPYKSILF